MLIDFQRLNTVFPRPFQGQENHINRGAILSKPVDIVNEKAF
jgi:hypothetical protein